MKLKIYQIDAFTNKVFQGNYAAVIILEEWLSTELMQQIATENNLSETAFALKNTQNIYEIRWFSPMSEIDFCGHATLATAFVLFKENESLEKVIFTAKAVGDLSVEKLDTGYIQMTFPNREPKVIDIIPKELLSGLSIVPSEVLLNQQAYFAVFSKEEDVYLKHFYDSLTLFKGIDLKENLKSDFYIGVLVILIGVGIATYYENFKKVKK